ncbi:MAG: MFS transporter [Promethearchaeota archaeon]
MTTESINITEIEAQSTSMKNIFLWSSYDAADTLFSQSIISIVFQPLILLVAFEQNIGSYSEAFLYMSLFMAFSNLLVALIGPMIGALSDVMGKRKPAVIISASLMMLATLGFLAYRDFWWLSICFVVANFAYQSGRMFYDSMIPFLAKADKRGFASAISGSLSFIGTFAGIGLAMVAWSQWGDYSEVATVYDGSAALDYGGLFGLTVITVIVIFLFAVPFLFSKEKETSKSENFLTTLKITRKEFWNTLKNLKNDKNAVLFFIAWFFVTDASNTTILYMQLVIVDGAGATPGQALIVVAMGGLLAMVGAIIVGKNLDKVGPKKNFIVNIIAWGISIVVAIVACIEIGGVDIAPWWIMIAVGFTIGIGFGGIWLIGRQFIYEIAPPNKIASYMGFKQIAGRVSAIASPLIFSAMMALGFALNLSTANAYSLALFPLILFFMIGMIIILRYKDVHKRYISGERAPYANL